MSFFFLLALLLAPTQQSLPDLLDDALLDTSRLPIFALAPLAQGVHFPPKPSLHDAGVASNAAYVQWKASKALLDDRVQRMRLLRKQYNAQLVEVDRLKRSRSSFRRNRKLAKQKALSQRTATQLQGAELAWRKTQQRFKVDTQKLTGHIALEMTLSPSLTRKRYLKGLGRRLAPLRSKVQSKKIILPDLELDVFADPEELQEQLTLMQKAETQLQTQAQRLRKRTRHFSRMLALQTQQNHVENWGIGEDIRRLAAPQRVNEGLGAAQDATQAPSPDSSPPNSPPSPDSPLPSPAPPDSPLPSPSPGFDESSSLAETSIVLGNIVDSNTQTMLRFAQQSASPAMKAKATRKAHDQVQARLLRLQKSKVRLLQHLQRLSKQRPNTVK